jgi:hypothetical protein
MKRKQLIEWVLNSSVFRLFALALRLLALTAN